MSPLPNQWSPVRDDLPPDFVKEQAKESFRFIPGTQLPLPSDRVPEWMDDDRYSKEYDLPDAEGQVSKERLYQIGALAMAIGKKPVTIRKWLRLGIIPEPSIRTRDIPNTLGNAGRRLWTRPQIETILLVGKSEGVIGDKQSKDISSTNFAQRLKIIWSQQGW